MGLQKRKLKADMIAAFKYLKGCCKEDGVQLFSLAVKGRMQSNGFRLQETKFRLDIQKNFLSVKEVKQWNRLPSKVVRSPSLDVPKRLNKN